MNDAITPQSAPGTWFADPGAVRAATERAGAAVLDELGVIAVRGADAVTFLQAQLTNDIAHLAPGHLQLAGYCSAKGRLLAVFDCWRTDDAVYLQLPREILPAIQKRLSMFVLRAKAKLEDASAEQTCLAVMGPGAAAALSGAGIAPPEAGQSHATPNGLVARLRDTADMPERFMVMLPAADLPAVRARLAAVGDMPAAAWWWSQIDAGVANVFAATQEKFVPQMINLEVLGGVNFKKGCYPGQEVVARSQYLGKLRRRLAIAHIDGRTRAGADVFAQGAAEAVGTVVMAATAPQGGMDLLFEAPVDRAAGAVLLVNAADGPRLDVRPLPYTLFDPTA
jgi:folate-binding protein YgfZ